MDMYDQHSLDKMPDGSVFEGKVDRLGKSTDKIGCSTQKITAVNVYTTKQNSCAHLGENCSLARGFLKHGESFWRASITASTIGITPDQTTVYAEFYRGLRL